MKNKLILTFLFCIITLFTNSSRSFSTSYNINIFNGSSTSNNAIINRLTPFVNNDTLNFTNALPISATSSIGNIGSFVLNLTGNSKTVDGANKWAGFNLLSAANYKFDTINLDHFKNASGGAISSIGTATVLNSSFTDNTATSSGGALYNSTGTINVTGSTFTSNTAANGGAIYNTGTSTNNITSSNFNLNTATTNGGALYNNDGATITGGSFTNNTANNSGGAIYNNAATGKSLSLTSTNFSSNHAANGGAIYESGDSTINGGTYSSNTASASGGAIYNNIGATTITDARFGTSVATGNSANISGGAIYNKSTSALAINTSNFTGNTSVTGGAIYGTGVSTTNITGSNFTSNSATSGKGGAIYSDGAITVSGGTFTSNTASTSGGAIYNNLSLNLSNNVNFTGNGAANGGAIYNSGDSTIGAVGGGGTFTSNTASASGGAIYNNTGTTAITGATFNTNSSTTSGGAIYNTSGSPFAVNTSTFTGNSSAKGGAIYDTAAGTTTINGSNFGTNTATTSGGAIYANGQINITGCTFTGNSVTGGNGGAIYNNTGNTLTLTNSNFSTNTASVNGGAIYSDGGIININATGANVTFTGNTQAGTPNDIFMLNSPTLNLTTTNSSDNITINGGIQGNGIINKLGNGNLNLNGTNTAFTGTYNNSAGKVTIQSAFFTGINKFTEGIAEIQTGGSLTLNSGDSWTSTNISNTGGALTLDGFQHNSGGTYNQTLGSLALSNSSALTLGVSSSITGGNVGFVSTGNVLNVAASGIFGPNAALTLNTNNTFRVSGGTATLNSNDNWSGLGKVDLTSGSLTLDGVTTNGIYTQTSGTGALHLSNASGTASTLTLGSGSTISTGTVDFVGTGNTLEVATNGAFNSTAAINISTNNTLKVSGGTATLNGNGTIIDTWAGLVNVTGGTLTLDNITNNATTGGAYSQNNGTLNIIDESSLTAFANSITGGVINVSSATATKSNLGLVYTADSIFNTNVQLQGNGTLTLDTNGHNVTNTSDTLISTTGTGNVLIKEGLGTYNYNLSGFTGNKQIDYGLNINKGTMNITGPSSGILTFGDTVNLGSGASSATLGLNAPATGTINLDNTINSNSHSNVIDVNSAGTGTVNFNNKISTVTLNIKNGITNVGKSSIPNTNVDNVAVNITGGTQDFTNSTFKNSSRVYVNDTTPTPAESTNFTNSTFDGYSYTGSGAAIYNGSGNVNIIPSNFSDFTSSGDGGAIYNSGTITTHDSIYTGNTATNGGAVYNSGTLTSNTGTYNGNTATNGGAVYNSGIATFTNTTFTGNHATANGGAIYNLGTMYLKADGGQIVLSGNTAGSISNGLYNHGTVYLNAGNGGTIVFNDTVDSSDITTSTININSPLGSSTLNTGTVYFNNNITNSTINLYNGAIVIGNESYISSNNLGIYDGIIDTQNNHIGTMGLNNATFVGISDWLIDVDLANKTGDTITTTGTTSGILNISSIKLLSEANAINTIVPIADANTKNHISTSVSSVNGALFKYGVSYDSSVGALNFIKTGISPYATAGSVAQTSTFLLQIAMDQQLFGNVDSFMSFPLAKRESTICCALSNDPPNGYTGKSCPMSGNGTFSPIYSCDLNKGIWMKNFVSFENIPLHNGPDVSTIQYGTLVGGDNPFKYLGHGIVGNTSAYVGYLGSNQNYDGVGISQNGVLVGLAENMVRGNNFLTVMSSVGDSLANATTPYGQENFSALFAGAAAKCGHNFEFKNGEYIFQPNLMLAYTFTNTFNYKAVSGINMTSKPLNATQVAPGLKFIKNMKEGNEQIYLVTNMVFNEIDKTNFTANEFPMPQLSINPYVEYGFGYQRVIKERFSGFFQALFRGGGRNGVAFQFGLRWAI